MSIKSLLHIILQLIDRLLSKSFLMPHTALIKCPLSASNVTPITDQSETQNLLKNSAQILNEQQISMLKLHRTPRL